MVEPMMAPPQTKHQLFQSTPQGIKYLELEIVRRQASSSSARRGRLV